MGLRFRKSIKIAPGVKVNFGKKSSSVTFGGKGLHHTVSSTGRSTTTAGIPGTGLSYSKTTSTHKKKTQDSPKKKIEQSTPDNDSQNFNNNKKWYQKTSWIIFFLIFFFPVGLFLMWKSDWKKTPKVLISIFYAWIVISSLFTSGLEQAVLTADTGQIYDIDSQVPIDISTTPENYDLSLEMFETSGGELLEENDKFFFTASEPGDYTITMDVADVDCNQITLSFEDTAAKEREKAEAEAKAEEERIKAEQAAKAEEERIKAEQQAQEEAAAQVEEQQANDPIVYITDSGSKYHAGGCKYLKKSKIEKHLSDVKGSYQPCGVCNPPT